MPKEHSNNSACSHKQQILLCITIVSLHLWCVGCSSAHVSQSWASVLAVGPHAQIFPCPWNLFILCAVDDDSKPLQFHIEEQYSEILQMQFFTSSHHVVLLLLLSVNHNSCTLLVQLFLLTITFQPLAALFQLLKYKTEKNGKMSQFELFSMFYDGFMIFANHCLCVYT